MKITLRKITIKPGESSTHALTLEEKKKGEASYTLTKGCMQNWKS